MSDFKTVRMENSEGRVQFAESAIDYHNFVARGYREAEEAPKVSTVRPAVKPVDSK